MFAWIKRRREASALIEADAMALIEQFGDDALEARLRSHGDEYEGPARSQEHWAEVKEVIGGRNGNPCIRD
jgi:hypothetical protein